MYYTERKLNKQANSRPECSDTYTSNSVYRTKRKCRKITKRKWLNIGEKNEEVRVKEKRNSGKNEMGIDGSL